MGAPLAFWNEFHYLVNVTTLVARAPEAGRYTYQTAAT
jgi:hypothetical protein